MTAFRLPVVSRHVWRPLCFLLALSSLVALPAAENRPVVGLGATREEVLAAYGWPSGQSQAGDREVLTYPQGQVILRGGVVERMEFSTEVPWPAPKPRPAPPTTSTAPAVAPSAVPLKPLVIDVWLTDFAEAREEAARRPADILALFTGTDWSPPCKRFQDEVALHPEFLAAVQERFVLLRLEFPTHTPQPAGLRAQNTALRERFGITTYPTLLLLDGDGNEISRVNLAKARSEETFRAQVVAAIEEARPQATASTLLRTAPGTTGKAAPALTWRQWLRASLPWVVAAAVALLLVCWRLWRRQPAAEAKTAVPERSSLMPSPVDIAAWPQERLREVVAQLFEYEGTRVQLRTADTGADLAVYSAGSKRPKALVRCAPAAGGLVGARALRSLVGTAMAEKVESAWFVSPGGFTADARQFVQEQGGVSLVGGEDLLQRLRSAPPQALIRILASSE